MSDQSTQPNPFRSRRFILSVVVVAVIALCAVIVLISNLASGAKDNTAPMSSVATSTATAKPASDPDPSVCGLKGYETVGTISAAPDTKWELVGTVAAPTDPSSAGPGTVDSSGFRSCFSHTPTGALFGAVNVMALASDRSLTTELANKLVVPGPGQKALLNQATSATATARYQIAGFKIDSYSDTTATVDLAVNFSTGETLSFPIQLQWLGGDWKVKTTDDGGFTLAPAPLQSLGGYIPWSGA